MWKTRNMFLFNEETTFFCMLHLFLGKSQRAITLCNVYIVYSVWHLINNHSRTSVSSADINAFLDEKPLERTVRQCASHKTYKSDSFILTNISSYNNRNCVGTLK